MAWEVKFSLVTGMEIIETAFYTFYNTCKITAQNLKSVSMVTWQHNRKTRVMIRILLRSGWPHR